ncbi:MAG: hypothetical protein ACOCY0_04135, partial [Roseicyclus sp.]
ADAARLAGVSSAQLGGWSRQIHGAAPSRYELPTIAMAAALRELSRAGFQPSEFVPVIRLVAVPILAHAETAETVAIEAAGAALTDAERARFLDISRAGQSRQEYAWFPLPLRTAGEPLASVYLLADLEDARPRTLAAPAGLLLDLSAVGARIAARARGPLVRYRVKEAAA